MKKKTRVYQSTREMVLKIKIRNITGTRTAMVGTCRRGGYESGARNVLKSLLKNG